MWLSGLRVGSMRNLARAALLVWLAMLVFPTWSLGAIAPVAAQEEATPTPSPTVTPVPTPGSSTEEVFVLGSGSSYLVVNHSVSWGEITIIAVLLILIFVVAKDEKYRKG